ncbi:MAG: CTP synthase, partial [Bacteroidales bacterium]
IYEVPLTMMKEKLDEIVLQKLGMKDLPAPNLKEWSAFLQKLFNPKHEINIALVGKYVELQDAYKSILESFIHAGAVNECKVNVHTVHSEFIDNNNIAEQLAGMDGILVAPGFGERGIEGKIIAVKYAREKQIPFFGICLGMQMAVIEYSRNVLGLKDAMTTEINPTTQNPVIDLMEEQKTLTRKGGTMRLGAYECDIKEETLAYKIYGTTRISERHRHRYEFNNNYVEQLENAGMVLSGRNPETGLIEIIEVPNHPFFIGVQFHPELKSTVENPQPIFIAFIKAAMEYSSHKEL